MRVSIRRKAPARRDAPFGLADALRRIFLTVLASYLQFRGWIRQETLCDRSSATFDLRQCANCRLSARAGMRARGTGRAPENAGRTLTQDTACSVINRSWKVLAVLSTRPFAWGDRANIIRVPSSAMARPNWVGVPAGLIFRPVFEGPGGGRCRGRGECRSVEAVPASAAGSCGYPPARRTGR